MIFIRGIRKNIHRWREEAKSSKTSRYIGEKLLHFCGYHNEILIPLDGGLGNQIWSYVVGKSIFRCSGLDVFFSLSAYYKKGKDRPFELLDVFPNIKINEPNKIKEFIYRNFLRLGDIEQYVFDKEVISQKRPTYMDRFLGHKDYFLISAEETRKEFIFSKSIQEQCRAGLSKIKSSEVSISVHIRRGDYLKMSNYEVTTVKYFLNAVNFFKEKFISNKLHFFFFSDGMDWAREELAPHISEDITFVDGIHNKGGAGDMFLMSQCNHQIISNSTFSWCAAWLNQNPQKIIITPNKWFSEAAPQSLKINGTETFAMPDWVVIDV